VWRDSFHIRRWAPALPLGVAVFATLLLAHDAAAESRTCRQLRAQISALPSGQVDEPTLYRRYDRAVAEQRQELASARGRAQAGGCSPSFETGSDQCQAVTLKIAQMETNLADLQQKRSRLAGGPSGGFESERRRLQAELNVNGCFGQPQEDDNGASEARQEGGLFDRLEGNVRITSPSDPFDDGFDQEFEDLVEDRTAYRTMCVRTCDGYYFPMSPASTRDDFGRDQQNCESICPGAEVRTYYQRQGVDDAATMMSAATGEPYADLPTSFAYKRSDIAEPSQCSCARVAVQQNFSVIAGETSAPGQTLNAAPAIPTPSPKPDMAADPETLANIEGKLDAAAIRAILAPKATKPPASGERRIRAVGPAFLPDPATAADRRVPGLTPTP
jgi:hypothetical protein